METSFPFLCCPLCFQNNSCSAERRQLLLFRPLPLSKTLAALNTCCLNIKTFQKCLNVNTDTAQSMRLRTAVGFAETELHG